MIDSIELSQELVNHLEKTSMMLMKLFTKEQAPRTNPQLPLDKTHNNINKKNTELFLNMQSIRMMTLDILENKVILMVRLNMYQ